jgi:hypothetical protein
MGHNLAGIIDSGGANGDILSVMILSGETFNMYSVFGSARFGYSELTLS